MSVLVRCLVCSLLGVTLWIGAPARADDAKQARTLFERGLEEADATHWLQAAELFQQALALRDSPVIRFNLSSALGELGKLTEAVALLEALEQDKRTSAELMQRVTRDRALLRKRLASLTLRVDAEGVAWQLLLDEHELPREQIGVPIRVDPKLHYVSLREGERVLDDAQLELAEGETRELVLAGKVPPPVVAQRPAPLELTLVGFGDPSHDDGMSTRKRRVIWGVSVAAAAVAAGVVAGVMLANRDQGGGASSGDAFSPGRVGVRVPQ
ncbi:MAG TPA: hypothetical protein VFX59_30220 [Polyangiales bacterium]|nr:hypothetical protein [Polyangiales bacterium]